jgi:transcriptional antiterminator
MEVIRENIDQLRKDLRITIDENSISYTRLTNHLKYLLLRLDTKEKLQMDISDFTKTKFPFAYEQATNMCQQLSKVLDKEIPETEIGYLALHLERILSLELK